MMVWSVRLGRVYNEFQREFIGIVAWGVGWGTEWFVVRVGGVRTSRERMGGCTPLYLLTYEAVYLLGL